MLTSNKSTAPIDATSEARVTLEQQRERLRALAREDRENLAKLKELVQGARAKNTGVVYRGQVRRFCAWASGRSPDVPPLPADAQTVALYLADCARRKLTAATLRVAASSIAAWHRAHNCKNPCDDELVRAALRGAACTTADRAKTARTPLRLHELRKLVAATSASVLGARDRAMVLLGFYAALRRSELVALVPDDVTREPRGLVVRLRRSKTDQTGRGIEKVVPALPDEQLDPVRALDAWLAVRPPHARALFCGVRARTERLSPSTVEARLEELLLRAGITGGNYGPHSLRAGWATEAAARGARVEQIQQHLGHASPSMALRYVRAQDRWSDHPGVNLF